MGQGQGDLAIEKLLHCARNGHWLNLQNVHLVTGWLPTLEKHLDSCDPSPKFRLWLTSEAHQRFPVTLLQQSLKITVEAPPGVKKNLQRTFQAWGAEFISKGSVLRAQALFSLAWFHAVIQERRTYIPQGWNKFYEFSAADLRSSSHLLSEMCMQKNVNPSWKILRGVLENAVYGARIDDKYDIQKLSCYLQQYFSDEVFLVAGRQPIKKIAKNISLPSSADFAEYVRIIEESVPDVNTASIFGLPENIDRSLQQTIMQSVFSQLKLMV